MVGAVLTQSAAWINVEKAILNLKRASKLTPDSMNRLPPARLAQLIRPAGYFNVKAGRLKHLVKFIFSQYGGDLKKMFAEDGETLRHKLLGVKGIGKETADSILLYAAGKPFFVVDAYTKRVFIRHRLQISKGRFSLKDLQDLEYDQWRSLFEQNIPVKADLYNDFHAQIVAVGKNHCKAGRPLCQGCPLEGLLAQA